jgi:hypothetical protein
VGGIVVVEEKKDRWIDKRLQNGFIINVNIFE